MKKISTLIAIILIALVSVNAQSFISEEKNKEFNKVYNDYVYLYRNVYDFIQNNNAKKIDIYSDNIKIKSIIFDQDSKDSKFKSFLLFTSDSTDKTVNKVRISNSSNRYKIFDVANNDIEMLDREETEKYSKNQVQHMYDTDEVFHYQGEMTMENRMDSFKVDFWGEFTEVLSKDSNWKIFKTDTKRSTSIIKTYFDNRFKSEHWSAISDMLVDKYGTYYLQKGFVIYSITVMIDGKMK